jgi:hypothetical protein
MIRVSRTFVRPNTNTSWYHDTPEGQIVTANRIAKYGNKLSNPVVNESTDGKTWTHNVTWASQEDYNIAMSDSSITNGITKRKLYNNLNGIVESQSTITPL